MTLPARPAANDSASGHGATRHWLHQRMTAIANIPLMLWLVWSVVHMVPMSRAVFTRWLSMPCHGLLMVLALLSVFYHAALGTQVIAEDYIQDKGRLKATVWALRLYFILAAVTCFVAVIRISAGRG